MGRLRPPRSSALKDRIIQITALSPGTAASHGVPEVTGHPTPTPTPIIITNSFELTLNSQDTR